MAQEDTSIDRILDAVTAFGDHLVADGYLGWRFGSGEEAKPGLLECVQHWLDSGDASVVCVSYEDYLLVVLEIIGQWSLSDGTEAAAAALWPHPGRQAGPAVPLAAKAFSDAPGAFDGGEAGTFHAEHPALQRSRFEAARRHGQSQ